jgi:uncharacterized membrane protein YphA (DoxX/SURF4 family)
MTKDEVEAHPIGWLVLTCRVVLGGLFIFAAYMKLKDPQAFADSVLAFKIIPDTADHLTTLTTFIVPWTELVAAIVLILGLWARAGALVLSLMLVAFIVGISSVLYRHMDVSCGCFGRFEWPCRGNLGWCQIGRDVAMLAMGLLVVLKGPGPLAIDRESSR